MLDNNQENYLKLMVDNTLINLCTLILPKQISSCVDYLVAENVGACVIDNNIDASRLLNILRGFIDHPKEILKIEGLNYKVSNSSALQDDAQQAKEICLNRINAFKLSIGKIIADKCRENTQLIAERNNLKLAKVTLRDSFEDLSSKYNALQGENNNLKSEIKKLQRENLAITLEYNDTSLQLQQQIAHLKQNIQNLQATINSLKAQNNNSNMNSFEAAFSNISINNQPNSNGQRFYANPQFSQAPQQGFFTGFNPAYLASSSFNPAYLASSSQAGAYNPNNNNPQQKTNQGSFFPVSQQAPIHTSNNNRGAYSATQPGFTALTMWYNRSKKNYGEADCTSANLKDLSLNKEITHFIKELFENINGLSTGLQQTMHSPHKEIKVQLTIVNNEFGFVLGHAKRNFYISLENPASIAEPISALKKMLQDENIVIYSQSKPADIDNVKAYLNSVINFGELKEILETIEELLQPRQANRHYNYSPG